MFVVTKTVVPVPKRRKLESEATASFNPIPLNLSNTQTQVDIIEEELKKANVSIFERGDSDSSFPITILSNVSTSLEA